MNIEKEEKDEEEINTNPKKIKIKIKPKPKNEIVISVKSATTVPNLVQENFEIFNEMLSKELLEELTRKYGYEDKEYSKENGERNVYNFIDVYRDIVKKQWNMETNFTDYRLFHDITSNPEKIKVIYSGINDKFKPIKSNNQIRQKYNLPDEFILYFGTIEPRKNLIGLIKAFELIRHRHKIKLVIAGTKGWLYKNIFKSAQNSKYNKDIIFTGFVEEDDKPYLYNLASVFVYPSFFEGFGFPPLEAMACGIPTIVSHNSSLPEVVGAGAVMIDPYNIDELAWAMEIALTDEKVRAYLMQKGIEQAKKFSWQKCAQETLKVILGK